MATTNPSGKRLIRSKSGMRIIPLNEQDRSPFELGEPEWVPDEESLSCMECKQKFDFLNRRHHCRRCGRLYCASCCKAKIALPRMCFLDPVRLCSSCATTTAAENRFYHHQLKSLVSGAILVSSGVECTGLANCRLSTDHKMLLVNTADSSLNVPLHRLTAVHITKGRDNSESEEGLESSGNEEIPSSFFDSEQIPTCSGVVLIYRSGSCELEEEELSLTAPEEAAPSAYSFLFALQKAALMAIEARAIIGTG